VNPFVSWIWLGLLTLICGCSVSLWPELGIERASAWRYARAGLAGATGVLFTVLFAQSLAQPFAAKWASAPSPEAPASARASTAP
jgi:membrane associated rhomboid family serine protease